MSIWNDKADVALADHEWRETGSGRITYEPDDEAGTAPSPEEFREAHQDAQDSRDALGWWLVLAAVGVGVAVAFWG